MTAVDPGPARATSSTSLAGAPPGRLDVQDLRARGRRSPRASNPTRRLRVGAVHYQPDPQRARGRSTTYDGTSYLRLASDLDRARRSRSDNTVYAQLTLDLGAENVARDGAQARRPLDSEAATAPTSRRSASARPASRRSTWPPAYATLAAGGVYSEPTGDPEGRFSRTARSTRGRLGQAERQRVIPDGVA